jgi:ADP-heptose:LPS heptosyltransferase
MGWGDEIIVTGVARRLQEEARSQLRVRVLDARGRARWHPIWDHNPRLARAGWPGPALAVTNGPGCRPYIARETARRWFWRDWVCPVGELRLTEAERAFGAGHPARIVVEPALTAKASPNKQWGRRRWEHLAALLARQGYRVSQLGPAGTPVLPGAERIETTGFRHACAVLASARLAILPEGALHHAAAALGVPSIVLFGGFISPRQTGYPHQVNLFTGGEPCGSRVRCGHCTRAMNRIEPEAILDRASALLGLSTAAGFD